MSAKDHSTRDHSRATLIRNLLIAVLVWEIAGRFHLIADGALPGPSEILIQFWADRSDYPDHVAATLSAAFAGFIIGNALAVLAGILFVLSPVTARLARGVNIALFALPPIAIVPILVLTLDGLTPRIVLAALGCYFATMTATVIGLSQIDARSSDVVRAYGGGRLKILRFVQLRSAVPTILSGLRIAAPNAVLGAILAEFGGGGRWGLGTYLLGSLGRADPPRLWGIGLVATLIAGLAYLGFALLANHMTGATRAVTIPTSATPRTAGTGNQNVMVKAIIGAGAVALPFIIWWALVAGPGLPQMIAKTPLGVIDYLFIGTTAPTAQAKLLAALGETLPITLFGIAAGLLVAFGLAIASQVSSSFSRTMMPVALVTQSMPLVALTPLLVLLLGRGVSVTIAITVSVTFFPAFVTIAQGITMVPRAALDLPKAYGATKWKEMSLVAIPAALPYLFAAARLAVPRALLGVMIAEWLATGVGLGNLLNQSRGYLDFGMIWTVALVSVVISIIFYQGVVVVERFTLSRMGMRTTE